MFQLNKNFFLFSSIFLYSCKSFIIMCAWCNMASLSLLCSVFFVILMNLHREHKQRKTTRERERKAIRVSGLSDKRRESLSVWSSFSFLYFQNEARCKFHCVHQHTPFHLTCFTLKSKRDGNDNVIEQRNSLYSSKIYTWHKMYILVSVKRENKS